MSTMNTAGIGPDGLSDTERDVLAAARDGAIYADKAHDPEEAQRFGQWAVSMVDALEELARHRLTSRPTFVQHFHAAEIADPAAWAAAVTFELGGTKVPLEHRLEFALELLVSDLEGAVKSPHWDVTAQAAGAAANLAAAYLDTLEARRLTQPDPGALAVLKPSRDELVARRDELEQRLEALELAGEAVVKAVRQMPPAYFESGSIGDEVGRAVAHLNGVLGGVA